MRHDNPQNDPDESHPLAAASGIITALLVMFFILLMIGITAGPLCHLLRLTGKG